MIRLSYDINVDDYLAYNVRLVCGPTMRPFWSRYVVANLVAWPLVTAVLLFLLNPAADDAMGPRDIAASAGIVFLILLVLLPISAFLYPRQVRRMTRKLVGSEPDEFFLGAQQLVAGADGVTVEGGGVTARYGWRSIKRLDETGSHLFLMTGRVHGIIVPKRGLDAQALAALKETVQAEISRSGR